MDRFIIQSPDPRLAVRAREVVDFELAKRVAHKMLEIAYRIRSTIYTYPRGFEVAAPQLGEPHRLILLQGAYSGDPAQIESLVMVNPEIVSLRNRQLNWEDCLSVKDMRGYVERFATADVRYNDLHGRLEERTFEGNVACDIQHGVHHLDGKLFFDCNMVYFIPLSVYRPLKDVSEQRLLSHVTGTYAKFDPLQYFDSTSMEERGLIHPRQCLLLTKARSADA
jgi:peptide deformylase